MTVQGTLTGYHPAVLYPGREMTVPSSVTAACDCNAHPEERSMLLAIAPRATTMLNKTSRTTLQWLRGGMG
jgi:hypothetical protein